MFFFKIVKKDMGDHRIKLRKKLFFLTFVLKILILQFLFCNYLITVNCAVIDINNKNNNNNINNNYIDNDIKDIYQNKDESDKNLNLLSLPKMVMEGLGLKRSPDVANVSSI